MVSTDVRDLQRLAEDNPDTPEAAYQIKSGLSCHCGWVNSMC